ncbi:MAG: AMP-binding protein, partial [Mycobacteriales bacterium]
PKGATFTHENIAFNALNVLTAFALTAGDEILTAVPMFHVGGLLIHTLPGLCAGATITIHREFNPGQLLDEIRRQHITLLACVPAMTFALASHPDWDAADLSSLRLVLTGSTIVPPRAIEPWQRKGVTVVQGYGGTEACPTATTMPPGSPPEASFTAGKPAIYTQIRVVDQSGRDAAIGDPGEVWIRGPAVMQGYWENEQATREAFCDGWFRTGDLGLIGEDGYLHIVDRIKDIIIVGASNVYPRDLEAVLDDCAEIREAAAVGIPDRELGEVPVACVVPTPGRTLTAERVIGLFENRLATYKHPRDVIFLDALPRNWHGKVDRRRLRDFVAQAQPKLRRPTVPGPSATERP